MGLKTEQLKCVDKFRDKNNKIIGYRLLDIYGKTHDMKANELKYAISKNLIHVVNLTLTSDNRLVDTTEKQLQSKQLGPEPQIETNNIVLKVAKELCSRCNYALDTSNIDEDSATINKKNDKIETYVYIELSTNNNIEITIGSDDFNFEKTVNSTDAVFKINSLIDNCKTPEKLLKLATFIGNNIADELPEYEIGHILEKLYNIYGLKEDTEKLIQSRISKLIKNKKQISRQEIIDASARSGDHKYIDKDTNDSEIITEVIKAGLWFEAITSSLSCGESAIYAYKSGCYKQYTYDTMTKEDDPSKMEEFMLQVAKTIFKQLGFNIEVENIMEIDNSYDGMIDKRYNINKHYMYFDEDTSMLSITYYGKDYEGVDKPEFWLGVDVGGEEVSSVHEIKAESMSKADIKNVIDEFIREVKPHISIY